MYTQGSFIGTSRTIYPPSLRATGSCERAPDDSLREAIHTCYRGDMDCFRLRSLSYGGHVVAEFIIGPVIGRTRWLLATATQLTILTGSVRMPRMKFE